MTIKSHGVLPYQMINEMIGQSKVWAKNLINTDQVQPSSLDLRLSKKAWRLQASFLPGRKCKITDKLPELAMHEVNLSNGSIFEKNCVYLVLLQESVSLPDDVTAIANAKSSIGRLDLLTRLITDYGTEFDRIPRQYSGPLYAEVSPRSFSVLVKAGTRLNQIRFRRGKVIINDKDLVALNKKEGLTGEDAIVDEGISFSVDLKKEPKQPIGYKAKANAPLIDLAKINFYQATDFWDPIEVKADCLILDPGAFYILMSKETVTVPPEFAAEMAPYLAMVGEFRVHYAGFFDPGFGFLSAGGAGSRGVLEIRCYESPFALRNGQIIGRLIYERMAEVPAILYGSDLKSNYQGQKLKLSKHFKNS
ncbi:MAG: 2'-deoxycytidine 5'-triphosphate deaminase [Paracoccaceae bacterium]|nr:2'-deoxycytidine 5'-triphosphate deaminase [Paracoccaceae bacterium]